MKDSSIKVWKAIIKIFIYRINGRVQKLFHIRQESLTINIYKYE